MRTADSDPKAFSSLDAVRRANDELIGSLPEDSSTSGTTECAEAEARTVEFMARVIETGAVLDLPADRKVAQGFINYWAARPYTAMTDGATTPLQSGRANTLLKSFDKEFLLSIVQRGEKVFLALSTREQGVMRRMLLHLLQVSDGGGVSLLPRNKESLYRDAEAKIGNSLIASLDAADVLVARSIDREELVELKYEALLRQWPRLRDWIDERVKFREAALYWVRTGRDEGALLSAKLAKFGNEDGELSGLEHEFVAKSLAHAARRRFVLVSAALMFLASPLLTWVVYKELYIPWRSPEKIALARSSSQPIGTRVDAIRWLAKSRYEKLDLTDIALNAKESGAVNLRGLTTPAHWNFRRAELTNVDLGKARLPAAQFAESAIANSRFDQEAMLEDADFSGARISDTSFAKSTLSRAVFDQALLCNVDFSESEISEASFSGVAYDDLPNFKGTAWWLASGWTLQQIDTLKRQFGGSNLDDIPSFKRSLDRFKKQLQNNPDGTTLEYVKAQDGIAWTYAIYGADLDSAEIASRQARASAEKLSGVGEFHFQKVQSFTADTLGYILLQKGRAKEAVQLLQEASKFEQNPGATFRLALALSANGREGEALTVLKSALAGYSPSHELYLLRHMFSGEVEAVLNDQQPSRTSSPLAGRCR